MKWTCFYKVNVAKHVGPNGEFFSAGHVEFSIDWVGNIPPQKTEKIRCPSLGLTGLITFETMGRVMDIMHNGQFARKRELTTMTQTGTDVLVEMNIEEDGQEKAEKYLKTFGEILERENLADDVEVTIL